jgi:septum formation protein
MTQPVVLASASPRRRLLLAQLDVPFEIAPSGIDERVPTDLSAVEVVRELAVRKARAAAGRRMTGLVLAADTEVAVDDRVLGKPADEADAMRMLGALRGRTHTVATGVAVIDVEHGREAVEVDVAHVTMRDYTDDEIADYVATGEPLDKAGAYAIQGAGRALVRDLEGRLDTVIGLPLHVAGRLLGLDGG